MTDLELAAYVRASGCFGLTANETATVADRIEALVSDVIVLKTGLYRSEDNVSRLIAERDTARDDAEHLRQRMLGVIAERDRAAQCLAEAGSRLLAVEEARRDALDHYDVQVQATAEYRDKWRAVERERDEAHVLLRQAREHLAEHHLSGPARLVLARIDALLANTEEAT